MPNLTISVPEKLKAEMDTLPEVNWSEICRGAISRYIEQRQNPVPRIELELRNAMLTPYDFETGYPTLRLSLRIHNKMDSEITVDRILANPKFVKDAHYHAIGTASDLHRRVIKPNAVSGAQIHLTLPREKIFDLKDVFNSTFECHIRCVVYAEGFKNEYNQELKTRIPIDDWNDVVSNAVLRQRRGERTA